MIIKERTQDSEEGEDGGWDAPILYEVLGYLFLKLFLKHSIVLSSSLLHSFIYLPEKLLRLQPYKKNYRHLRTLGAREVAFPREERINWLFLAKCSALRTYMKVTLYRRTGYI